MTSVLLLVFFGFFMIFFYNVHYMILLFLLEVLLLGVFLFVGLSFLGVCGVQGMFIFLLVMVCMGGFGISLLVSLSRFVGRDFWFFYFIF